MNIGWFALVAKSLGHRIVAFEPNPINQLRMCESLKLNNWTDTTDVEIYGYGVGDKDSIMKLYIDQSGNPGANSFIRENEHYIQSRVITLDSIAEGRGWIEKQSRIALLKIDVEGYESFVFLGATKLIHSGVVKNIFMEYSCEKTDVAGRQMITQQLIQSSYILKLVGMWNGAPIQGALEIVVGTGQESDGLPDRLECYCKDRGGNFQLNLWWTHS